MLLIELKISFGNELKMAEINRILDCKINTISMASHFCCEK
jgi:hypothetical protein